MSLRGKLPLLALLLALVFVLASVALGAAEWNDGSPEKRLRECQQRGDRHEQREEREDCQRRCLEDYRREKEERGGRAEEITPHHKGREEEEKEHKEQQQGKPYVFEDQHFTTKHRTEHGRVRVLQKFTERSEILRGIENYRVAILEADPQTFIVPNHRDAETIIFIANGRGSVSIMASHDKRESFNLRLGDVMRIPAGTTVYLINRSNNEKLVIVKLLQPVSTPGHFETFFGPGGEDPESYYKAFSTELLEAALNTRKDKIQKIFGQQRRGVIIKASEEQIRAMSQHKEGGVWPFGGESKGPVNLFSKRPEQANQYGQLYEVDPSECRELKELDLGVGFANITKGSMMGPFYNSRATKIAIVTNGQGYFEMACPHLSSSEFSGGKGSQHGGGGLPRHKGKTGPSYQKVRAQLKQGVVYVVPAGHPIITVASNDQNLEIVCFDINAKNNKKFFLAGKTNIMNQLEREAKELGFGVPAREVDEVFKSQNEDLFFKGPHQHHHESRADA
ncbi:hypothetical protein Acr_13g0002110 [Actinidia rufa]|uniref:Cupin type-1 domain-containing protein n=1 Tax=Actinidia rufa TaxID=165716 RepID=A0A7J0FJE6_9ERIC|nr:hypothetical protein Acr_13g0002110 [Actinidia rufa]